MAGLYTVLLFKVEWKGLRFWKAGSGELHFSLSSCGLRPKLRFLQPQTTSIKRGDIYHPEIIVNECIVFLTVTVPDAVAAQQLIILFLNIIFMKHAALITMATHSDSYHWDSTEDESSGVCHSLQVPPESSEGGPRTWGQPELLLGIAFPLMRTHSRKRAMCAVRWFPPFSRNLTAHGTLLACTPPSWEQMALLPWARKSRFSQVWLGMTHLNPVSGS